MTECFDTMASPVRRRLLGTALCMALVACAAPPRIAGGPAFDRVGRFAVLVTEDLGKQDAVQGGFAWHDEGSRLRLDLANPLGSVLAQVTVEPGYAVLVRADGSQERASHPDALVEQVLGSAMPVEGLRDWLRGRTGPMPVGGLERDAQGRPTSFEQNGWHAALSRYDSLGPRLLVLKRREPGRQISVRLIVDGN